MLGYEHPDGLTHSQQTDRIFGKLSAVTAVSVAAAAEMPTVSRQTRIFGKLSAVTAVSVAAAAEMIENEPNGLGR